MKRWQIVVFSLLVALLVFLYYLPQVISHPTGNNALLSIVNRYIAGKVHFQKLTCAWEKGIAIEGILLFDPENRQVASIETFTWNAPLLAIIFDSGITGRIDFAASFIDLIGEKNRGCFSIERLIWHTPSVTSQNQSDETIRFSNCLWKSNIKNSKEATLDLTSLIDTQSRQKTGGKVDIHLATSHKTVALNGTVDRFPADAAVTLLEVISPEIAAQISPFFGDIPQTLSFHISGGGSFDKFALSFQIDPLTLYAGEDTGTLDVTQLEFCLQKAKDCFGLTCDLTVGINKKDSLLHDIFGNTLSLFSNLPIQIDDETITLRHAHAHIQSEKILSTQIDLSCQIEDDEISLLEPISGHLWATKEQPNPVNFSIDPEGFLIPLSPFSVKTIAIKSMKVEPGLQKCKNGRLLSLLISFLKISWNVDREVALWFTPVYLDLHNGIVNVQRADFLFADRFPLAFWGQIDLPNNQLDMTLGISPKTLSRAFLIISLDKTNFVQVPIRGPIENPTFDSGRAAAKIAALRLQQTLSPPTAILGTILRVVSSVGADDPPTPPPTTQPFPWKEPQEEK